MDYMLTEGDWLGSFADGDRLAECGIPAPEGGKPGLRWDGKAWQPDPKAELRAAVRIATMGRIIAAERANWTAQRWQMIVALGEANWATVLAFRDDPVCSWSMRQIIDTATEIPRMSETVDLLAYALQMTEAEVDRVFTTAMALKA